MSLKMLIFWTSYIWFPFVILAVFGVWKWRGAKRWLAVLAIIVSLPLAWARFVEPQMLLVKETEIDIRRDLMEGGATIRVALFSDTHFGIFNNAMSMQRIVDRTNAERVDAVFIAGDFLYELPKEDVASALAPLAKADSPVFAVMGNHDVGFPGPLYGEAIYGGLRRLGVTLVENRSFELVLNGVPVIVTGTSDLWEGRQNYDFKSNLPEGVPVILLTHNPDTALRVPNNFDFDLMLAGHTHGGQIRIPLPGITQSVIPTQYPFDTGLHHVPRPGLDGPRRVFVTPGTGMVGLPMRFRRPPRVDILTLRIDDTG